MAKKNKYKIKTPIQTEFKPKQLSLENKIGIGMLVLGGAVYATSRIFGRYSIPPLTDTIGDFALTPFPTLVADEVTRRIYTAKTRNYKLEDFASRLPRVTAITTALYFTIGETILPEILPGTPDIADVPAAILGAIAAYYALKR